MFTRRVINNVPIDLNGEREFLKSFVQHLLTVQLLIDEVAPSAERLTENHARSGHIEGLDIGNLASL